MARPSALSGLSNADLLREVARRERKVRTLARKRDKLMQKVAVLDAQIEQFGGRAAGGRGPGRAISGRRRASNSMSLVEALAKVLSGKTMGVTEAAEAVKKAGYATTSPNFRTIVNQALISNNAFKRVERGLYTAK